MTGDNKTRREKYILTLVKGGEKYIFIYDDEGTRETLRTLGKFASDPSLSFSWFDAATLSQRVRQLREESIFNCEGR